FFIESCERAEALSDRHTLLFGVKRITHHTLSFVLPETRQGGFHEDCAAFPARSYSHRNILPDAGERARSGARGHALRYRAGRLGRDSSWRHRDGHASRHHIPARYRLGLTRRIYAARAPAWPVHDQDRAVGIQDV